MFLNALIIRLSSLIEDVSTHKYVLKIFFLVIGGIILANFIKIQLVQLGFDPEQKYRRQITPLFEPGKANQIEVITVGNSHSISIDFNTLGRQGYHLWRPGSDLFETQYMLESWLPVLASVKTVLLVVTYESFYSRNSILPTASERHQVLYSQTPSWSMINNDFGNFIIGKLNRIVPIVHIARSDHWRNVFFNPGAGSLNDFPRDADGQLHRPSYFNCSRLSVDEMLEMAKDRREMVAKNLVAINPGITSETYQTLVEIIGYLQARNIRLVFYTPPYPELFNQLYKGQLESTLQQSMQQLQKDYRIEYYNYSTDMGFRDYRFYKDLHHLNLCGAKRFSKIIKDMLNHSARLNAS